MQVTIQCDPAKKLEIVTFASLSACFLLGACPPKRSVGGNAGFSLPCIRSWDNPY